MHTFERRPAEHRTTSGKLGAVEGDRGNWQAAYDALASASAAEEVLLREVTTGARGFDDILAGGLGAGEATAFVLKKLGRVQHAAEALEASRARTLSEALTLRGGDAERIADPDRRHRYQLARQELWAAEAAVTEVSWIVQNPDSDASAPSDRHPRPVEGGSFLIPLAQAVRAARERFNAILQEIEHAQDPPDLLNPRLDVTQLSANIEVPVVYLLSTQWGGLALKVSASGAEVRERVLSLELPALTDALVDDLVQVSVPDGSDRVVGGFASAQQGDALPLLSDWWPGISFAQKGLSI